MTNKQTSWTMFLIAVITGLVLLSTIIKVNDQLEQSRSAVIAMQKQIDKIVATCESHFAFEEGVLEIRHYPKVAEHIEIHKKLLTKAIKLKKAYERGTVRPTAFFSFLVDDVVLGHLLEDDVKFFPYVEEKGTKKKRS